MMDTKTMIDEIMSDVRMLAGASWPSADATRMALVKLASVMKKEFGEKAQLYDVANQATVTMTKQLSEAERSLKQSQEIRLGQGAIILAFRKALEYVENHIMTVRGTRVVMDALAFTQTHAEKVLDEVYEYLKGVGCDCGTDEKGTCGLCLMETFRKGE